MAMIRLDQLPPHLRAQVERKLREEDTRRNAPRIAQDAPELGTGKETGVRAAGGTAAKKRRREPNKTEARYAAEILAGLDARYEAITFRLASGHRYTPDWIVFENGRPTQCHEVKGAYRFHSHQRARLAFDQAAVEFPGLDWFWATLTKNGWEQRHA